MPSKKPKPKKPADKYEPLVSARLNALFTIPADKPNPEFAAVSASELLQKALPSINELFRRAKAGDDKSTDHLLRLALWNTGLLNELAINPTDFLRSLAHANPLWPSLHSPKRVFLNDYRFNDYQEVLARLEIGKDCQLNVSPKSRWTWNGTARWAASKIWDSVQAIKTMVDGHKNDHAKPRIKWTKRTKAAYKLPPLTQKTAAKWMEEFGWPFILDLTKGAPHEDDRFKHLGIHRKRHTDTAKPDSKTEASNIRDGIKKAITQALTDMASP